MVQILSSIGIRTAQILCLIRRTTEEATSQKIDIYLIQSVRKWGENLAEIFSNM